MCNFLSGYGFPDGSVKTSDYTDEHGIMGLAWGLKEADNIRRNAWVKLEYTYDDIKNACDINHYSLIIDETEIPDWVTDEIRESWTRKMNQLVKGMILTKGHYDCLLGGKWVLGGEVEIDRLVNCQIPIISGGKVNYISGGTVNDIYGGKVNYIRGVTVNYIWDTANVLKISGGTIINDHRKAI